MPAKRVIPCLDIKDGRVVKGIRFQQLRDLGSPVDLARRYDAEGADEVVFLDIAATEEQRGTRETWVRDVARELQIPFTVGGGVASLEDIRRLLRAGADKVAINSAALERPEFIVEAAAAFGRQCIVVAVDVASNDRLGWAVFSHGGKRPTGRSAQGWLAEAAELGAGEILLTSIDRDGTRSGYDLPLLKVASQIPVPLIASGGAGIPYHFVEALEQGADAVLAAGLFHEGWLTITQVKRELAAAGFKVRP